MSASKFTILHTAFFEAIKISKKNGLLIFDFGGYSKKGEKQMIGINRFKDGFKGDLIEYSEMLIFKTNYIPSTGRDNELGFNNLESFPKSFLNQFIHGFKKTKEDT